MKYLKGRRETGLAVVLFSYNFLALLSGLFSNLAAFFFSTILFVIYFFLACFTRTCLVTGRNAIKNRVLFRVFWVFLLVPLGVLVCSGIYMYNTWIRFVCFYNRRKMYRKT